MTNEKILIVEDDTLIGQHLAMMLTTLGYRVCKEIVKFGENVIEQVTGELPDLVLMDIELAGAANGVQTTQLLSQRFDIPVIYLTSFSDDSSLNQAQGTHPYGYLIKPVQSRELHAAIMMALQRHQMEIRLKESENALRKTRDELEKRVEERTAELVATNHEIRRHAAELEALASVSSTLRKATTLTAMLTILVEKTSEIFNADAVTLVLNRDGKPMVTAWRRPPENIPEESCPSLEILQKVISDSPVYCKDASQQSLPWQNGLFDCVVKGSQSYAFIPLITVGSTLGILHLGFHDPHKFSSEEQSLLSALAEMTGNALHRALLMETLEQRVADRTRELFTLYRITLLLREPLSLETILDYLLEETQDAVYCDLAFIHLLDSVENRLQLAGQKGELPPSCKQVIIDDLIWQVIRDKKYLLSDLAGFRYLGVPMRAVGRVVGVLSILADEKRQFSVEDIALLDSIADHAAATIETIELRKKSEQLAVSAERARLSRELHDSVTQSLYSLTLFAEAARTLASTGKVERAQQYLDQIYDIAHQSLKEMRLLIYALRPPILEHERLIGALRSRLDAVERRAGVEARFLVEEFVDLPLNVEEALYRITLEALNNSLKHSKAKNLSVRLHTNGKQLELDVSDDGVGFDPQAVVGRGGMGLFNMQERARTIGGELMIDAAPGKGTSVRVLIPIL
jgi:signal transduction histidine kinase/DNA-binding response OmpR family regulator